MKNFQWRDSFSLGTAVIDDDHRAVFDLVRRIIGLEPTAQPLDQLIGDLRRLLEEHVAREEELMRGLGHPEVHTLERHHAEQLQPLFTVLAMISRRGRITDETSAYLRTWLLHHIICHDLRLRDFLREKQACDAPPPDERRSWIARLPRQFDFLALRWRILLIAVLPLLAVLIAGAFGVAERLGKAEQMSRLRTEMMFGTRVGTLIHELQRERGLSTQYLVGTAGDESGDLAIQRARTDEARRLLTAHASRLGVADRGPGPELAVARGQIDRRSISAHEALGFYSNTIAALLQGVHETVATGVAPDIVNDALAYVLLMRAKEQAAIERAAGILDLATAELESLRKLRLFAAEQNLLAQEFLAIADEAAVANYRDVVTVPAAQVSALRERVLAAVDEGRSPGVAAEQWRTVTSARIEGMKRVEDALADRVVEQSEALHDEAWQQIAWVIGGALVLLAAALAPTALLGVTVLPPLAALHQAMRSLAAGNKTVEIPGTELRDEIGAMARTVQSFREGLINRDLLSLQAQLEVSGLVRGIADNVPGILFQQAQTPGGQLVCTYVSEKVQHYTGRAPDAFVGRANQVLMVNIHPDDSERVRALVAAAVAMVTPMHCEFRVLLPDGTQGWLRVAMAPRQTTEGATVWDGLALDVSELKNVEEQRAAAAARLSQLYKLQALTQMAGGMAHEINNLLQPIIGLSELALMELPPDTRVRGFIENVLLAGQQARDLVAKITSFSRVEPLERETVELATAIEDTAAILQGILPRTVTLNLDIADRNITVQANAGEIKQVLMNLCTNAVHAIGPRHGTISIGARRATRADGSQWAELSVSDTGDGIDESIIERIFDPFFTTKEVGRGTGLGLALVNSLVTGFGGHIDVRSRQGEGTTFTICLPLYAAQAPVQQVAIDE